MRPLFSFLRTVIFAVVCVFGIIFMVLYFVPDLLQSLSRSFARASWDWATK